MKSKSGGNENTVKRLHTFLKVTGMAIIYFILFQLFYNWIRWLTPWPYENVEILVLSMVYNFLPVFALFYLIYVIVFYNTRIATAWLKITLDIIVATVIVIGINYLFKGLTGRDVNWGGTFFNETFILLGMEIYYYVLNYNKEIREKADAREKALQYKYESLKAQIDPHFLFNSLNLLTSLIDIDTQKSKDFIISLSRMYRYIMSRQNDESVSVEEEISFLKNYIDILEMRYAGRLTVDLVIESEGALRNKIIPYTLQLLMENVCKHKVISSRYPMKVKIRVTDDGITFENPIRAKRVEAVSRVGTRYLINLYNLHHRTFRAGQSGDFYKVNVPYIS